MTLQEIKQGYKDLLIDEDTSTYDRCNIDMVLDDIFDCIPEEKSNKEYVEDMTLAKGFDACRSQLLKNLEEKLK